MITTPALLLAAALVVPVFANDHGITPAPHPTKRALKNNAAAAGEPLPLTQYTYSALSQVPYQVNPYPVLRGPQSGYNICNSTTVGPASQCQTLIANNISDFCLWGSPGNNATGLIGNVEAATVAYCTTDKHGTRVIPGGKISAVQFMRTKAYIQITGLIDQTGLNLDPTDTGGELDPHGADLAGNPLGGLVWSTGLPSGDNTTYKQAIEWNNFVGGGAFCIKLCDPTYKDGKNYCQNIYDLIGCSYNMPASYRANEFSSCEGELQDEAGTYAGADGKTSTWSQPSSIAPGYVMPWTPRVPASSNCVTYASTQLFAAAATTTSSGAASTSGAAGASSRSGSAGASSASSTSSGASSTSTAKASGAGSLVTGAGLTSLLALLSVVVLA